VIRRLRVPASAALDERIRNALSRGAPPAAVEAPADGPGTLTLLAMLMRKKPVRVVLGGLATAATVLALVLPASTTVAWSMDQTIAALQKYRGVFMVGRGLGRTSDSVFMLWGRANPSGTASEACLLIADHKVVWAKDNVTHYYEPAEKRVLVDRATTAFLSPWFGPKLFGMMSRVGDPTAREEADPVTGERRVSFRCSLQTAKGPESWLIEFDPKTKLPTRLKQWDKARPEGQPALDVERILYLEDVSPEVFSVHVPPEVRFVAKDLEIPEANLPLLADPKSGMSADGLSRNEACRRMVQAFWGAAMARDLARLRELCPLVSGWNDALVRGILDQDAAVELLEIGAIEKEGRSRLGSMALVPSRVRCRDGRQLEVKILVQFRETDAGTTSCVVHAPYGIPFEIGENTPTRR